MRQQPGLPPERKDQSNDLVRIVAVLYGIVLIQSLFESPAIVLHPFEHQNQVAALAMVVVFSAAGWRFLGFSLNMQRFPYDVRWVKGKSHRTGAEEARFPVDVLVALGFAILLLLAISFARPRDVDLTKFYVTLTITYVLALLSDELRSHLWDVRTIRSSVAGVIATFPVVILLAYVAADHWGATKTHRHLTNLVFLAVTLFVIHLRELIDRADAKRDFQAPDDPAEGDQSLAPAKPTPPCPSGQQIYLAGPLGFSLPGLEYQEKLKRAVNRAAFVAVDPWKNVAPETVTGADANSWVANENAKLIRECVAMLAVLDGSDVDSGTASEIGYAAALEIPVVGLRTDTRKTGDNPFATVNLQVEWMIRRWGGRIETTLDAAIAALQDVVPGPPPQAVPPPAES